MGFFTTGTHDAPGNYALWDILEALKFVNRYIKPFGGDEKKLTIMGHGEAAVFADLVSLSPLSKGLYSSLIMMDGSAWDPSVLQNQDVTTSRYYIFSSKGYTRHAR